MLEFKNLCASCFGELFDKNSSNFLNQKLVCSHIPNGLNQNSEEVSYSLEYIENGVIVLSNPAKLDDYFLIDEYEKQELLRFEKPILTVSIKDENLKNSIKKEFIKTKIMDSAPLSVLAYNLFNQQIPYFFISQKSSDFEVFAHKNRSYIITPSVFSASADEVTSDAKYNLIYNYLKEFELLEKKALIARCSNSSFLEFYLYENEEVTKIADLGQTTTRNILKTLATTNGPKERLADNIKSKMPELYAKIEARTSKNISIFELIAICFEDDISELATSFIGNGGLKLDMKFANNSFDVVSLLGSILSYKLAGVEDKIIAFSLYESIADFALHLLGELKSKHQVNDFVLFGDLLANQVFFSRIDKNGAGLAPKISTTFSIDV